MFEKIKEWLHFTHKFESTEDLYWCPFGMGIESFHISRCKCGLEKVDFGVGINEARFKYGRGLASIPFWQRNDH